MYIAVRWLVFMTIFMWALLCGLDYYTTTPKSINKGAERNSSLDSSTLINESVYKNTSTAPKDPVAPPPALQNNRSHAGVNVIHYFSFWAGAFSVFIYNRRIEIVIFLAKLFPESDTKKNVFETLKKLFETLKKLLNETAKKFLIETAIVLWVAIVKKIKKLWEFITICTLEYCKKRTGFMPITGIFSNSLLLRKLQEVEGERDNLAQLLSVASKDIKEIKFQHQMETLAKSRLLSQLEDNQKQLREFRGKCANLEQMYQVTNQDNLFLKARMQKLTRDKQEAERDFVTIFSMAYHSSDKNLKASCRRFAIKNRNNLINIDINNEILKVVQKSRPTNPSWQAARKIDLDDVKHAPVADYAKEPYLPRNMRKMSPQSIAEECDEESVTDEPKKVATPAWDPYLILRREEPKLRGLPGEYVWTKKDKDGIIEKLYEYDHGGEFDNGDTIRRIREYTVYHDKDCLLDLANSRSSTTTIIRDIKNDSDETLGEINKRTVIESLANRKFLTGSVIFHKFLENNRNQENAPAPPLLCG